MPGGGDRSRSLGAGLPDGAQGEGGVRRTLPAAAQLAPEGQGRDEAGRGSHPCKAEVA